MPHLTARSPAELTDDEVIQRGLDRSHDDPLYFQEYFLGRQLWSRQEEVCRTIAVSPITVVPAGRGVGKSFLLAGLVLWWLYTRPRGQVITTGPDHRQVVSVLWKEIRRAIRRAPIELGYDHLSEGFVSPQRLVIDEGVGGEWGALGFATKSDEGLSGQHAPDLLVIVDEASGVAQAAWDAIDGLIASRVIACGNPIKYDCHFRELWDHAEKGTAGISGVRISSLEHPHAEVENSPDGAVSASFLRLMRSVHGDPSPWWQSNILGIFPGAESVTFIPRAWLDRCTSEEILADDLWRDTPGGPVWMGVDVGGGVGADRSVVVVRDRKRLLEVFASERHGVLDDARHRLEPVVLDLMAKWGVPPQRVIYDKAGLGRSFASYLERESERRRQRWIATNLDQPLALAPPLLSGFVGYFGASKGGKLYINRRTANAYALKRRLDPSRKDHVPCYAGGIAEWPALRQELAELRSPEMEMDEGVVKQRLEDKDDLMARLKRSPDLMDALLMTFTFEG